MNAIFGKVESDPFVPFQNLFTVNSRYLDLAYLE